MAESINALTAPDQATNLSTIEGTRIDRLIVDVANQAIYWTLKLPIGAGTGGQWDGSEQYMAPGSRVIYEDCVGFRFRAAIPAAQIPATSKQAVVTVRAVT